MGGEQSKGKGDPEPKGGVAGGLAPGQVKSAEPPKSAAAPNGELRARVEEEPKSKTDPPIPAEPLGKPFVTEKDGPDILVQPRGVAPSAVSRPDPVVKEESVPATPHVESAVVERFLHLYTEEWAPDVTTVSLRTKVLGEDVQTTVCDIAATVGFPVEFEGSVISLDRPKGSVDSRRVAAADRLAKAQNRLSDNELSQVDELVEKDVLVLLNEIVDAFPASGKPKETVDCSCYLFPSDAVQGLLEQVAKVKAVTLSGSTLIGSEKKVDVVAVAEKEVVPLLPPAEKETSPSLGVAPAEADGNNDEVKLSPRVIPEGELVWRRLQHWCTNVRKEKKFNIWARNLDDRIKQKIIDIAMEVGFEAATIQPNGNIHVEIKPPADKQNRKRLRRPSPEVVEELIPVDKAVTENAAAHMQEWITEFAKSRKPRDTLNCRFALPADWIRKTATELAEASNLKVVQETGIELIFSRSDLTEEEIEEMLRKAKEEPKPAPLSARSPRDTRMSPRNPVRMSPRNPIRGRHSRGRSDGRGRGRGRWEFRSRTPPPNLSQYPARRTVPGMGPPGGVHTPMTRGPAPGHHGAGMQAPSWQQRPLSFHAPQHYAAPGSNFHPAFMGGSHSYGGGGSMGGGPFGGPSPYSLQHHHVNRGGSHSSRSYNDGYGPY